VLKKFAFTTTVTWPWVLHGLEAKIARFHCAFCAGKKVSNAAVLLAELSRHFKLTTATYQIKKSITSATSGFTKQTT
jgi:ribulose-5-phosphate 4-epimerase/fuculose-1-phosphate aldolase